MSRKIKEPMRRTPGAAIRAHPWITWGTAASIAAVLSMCAGAVLWTFTHFESAADADRKFAWLFYGQSKTNVLLLRNRVNECNSKVFDRKLTVGEKPACDQYQQEYDEEKGRSIELYKQAMNAGKDR